jgi:hypothetical protein
MSRLLSRQTYPAMDFFPIDNRGNQTIVWAVASKMFYMSGWQTITLQIIKKQKNKKVQLSAGQIQFFTW